jgi:diguanylate cyclase (GGDEF)-like protein
MLDLDHFKAVNDTYGHQAGDSVLQQLADILRATARDVDRLGRYGGEEFLAVLPATTTEGAEVFVDRVRAAVERHPFGIGRDEPVSMTISGGVATFPQDGVWSPELLIRRADEALYAAKADGRNRVKRFDHLDDETGAHA